MNKKGIYSGCGLVFFSVCLLSLILWVESTKDCGEIGYLSLSPGHCSIYFDRYDTTIVGDDIGGTVYFFLPSYIKLSSLDYSDSELILYRNNGELLQQPSIDSVEGVLVGGADGELTSYKVGFFCSENLSTIEIEMQDRDVDEISQQTYSQAKMRIISPEGRVEYSSDDLGVKGRGNMTWGLEKKPYDLKLKKKQSLAGLDASKKWTLLANDLDPVNLRNRLAFDTAGILGMEYVTESDWVDLYINKQYMGNYLLCHEVSGVPKGGVLLEQNALMQKKGCHKWTLPSGMTLTIKAPGDEELTERDKRGIEEYSMVIDDAIMNHLPGAQYESIDRYSFARRYLVDEISLNADGDFSSHFYYKKPASEMLYAGPCWDYDKSFGFDRPNRRDWRGTVLDLPPKFISWDLELMSDDEYQEYVRQTFEENYDALYNTLPQNVDEYYDKIHASLEMDRIKWNRGPEKLFRDSRNDIRYLKSFLYNRLHYMAEEYGIESEHENETLPDASLHDIILRLGNEEKVILTVDDGTLLNEDDLPDLKSLDYSGWVYNFDGRCEEITGFIPIYEDTTIVPDYSW